MTLTFAAELERAASDAPDSPFLRMRAGDLTYAQAWERARSVASRLVEEGVRPGDPVALLMANSPEQVVLWAALSRIGAVHAPLNTALVGESLQHAVRTTHSRLLIVDEGHRAAASAVDLGDVVVRPVSWAFETPRSPDAVDAVSPPDDDLSTATLLFTSGTTGRSKACALSHRYLMRQGQIHAAQIRATSDDVLYAPFPLFHIDAATLTVAAALSVRATAAIGVRFSASGFWDEVREFGATVFNFMGATLTILWKQPESDRDRDHRVRLAWGVPLPEWHREFERRFGLELRTVYGLTDAGVSVYDPLEGERRTATAGRVVPEYELRIDASRRRPGDPEGVGEILVRGREPGIVMNGYFGDPDATARTIIEGGWVRTGDLGALDDGFLTFHGRLSDFIRRRGENISAFEVEQVVLSHPAVVEAAAVGVPSELTEEDVLVCVVVRPGVALEPSDLREHCLRSGPAHMAPRYVRVVGSLPKTPTEKVEKFRLAEVGVAGAWDADATLA